MVPFSAFFPAGRADPTLIDRLTSPEQLQGLLRSAVGGLQAVMRRGAFALPPSVINATAKFKREADPLRGFLEERIKSHHSSDPTFTPRTELYLAYTTWAAVGGYHQMSSQLFYEKFAAAAVDSLPHPMVVVVRQGVRGYKGVSIK